MAAEPHLADTNILLRLTRRDAALTTIRDRSTRRAAKVRLRAKRSRSSCCSWLNHTLGACRNMAVRGCEGLPPTRPD